MVFLQRYLLNPPLKALVLMGALPTHAIVETVGRTSGKPRRTIVGNRLEGDTFWIVAEHGRGAAYVRNLEANPGVRVRLRGRWRAGTARVLPEDDPLARMQTSGRYGGAVRAMGTDLLTIRVDLDRS